MNEVSCKILDVFFWRLPKEKFAPEILAEGTGYTVKQLRNKQQRVSWETFLLVLANTRKVWSEAQLVELGTSLLDSPYIRPFSAVARLLFNSVEMYKWVLDRSKGVGEQMFIGCLENVVREDGPNRLVIDVNVVEGKAPCLEFFLVTQGSFIAMPRVLGLPYAKVNMTLVGNGARFDVTLPVGGGWLGRVRRGFSRFFTIQTAARELKEANETLMTRYAELESAREELAIQAAQLQTLNLLGRELTRYTELDPLADAVVQLLVDRFAPSGLAVWLIQQQGATESLLRQRGNCEGAAARSLPLEGAGRALGQIRVWGVSQRPSEKSDLLADLTPWITIAFENARGFEWLRESQAGLEQKVAERTQQLEASLEKLKAADRLKTEFFTNASHELRTPLTLILAPLEMLAGSDQLPEQFKEEVSGARRNGYRLLKLVNEVLDLSKLEAGKLRLQFSATNLARLFEQVVAPWKTPLSRRRISLELIIPGPVVALADPERLEQIALNLLSNAVKETPDGGSIRIGCSKTESGVEFFVENTGKGIDPAELPHLFERFAQSQHASSRRFGTTGLGLSVVRELVELHGGELVVENQPGRQVTFRVKLPLTPDAELGGEPVVPRATPSELMQYQTVSEPEIPTPLQLAPTGSKPRLLVAEDNLDLRNFLTKNLRAEFDVTEVADGLSAEKLAKKLRPDLILSDMMMPGQNGEELCRALKNDPSTDEIPFVLLTARGELDQKLTALNAGADDYLVKPFHVAELKARLRSQLRIRTLSKQVAKREKLAALGTLVAGVAHEIRNPLNGIINSLEPLQQGLKGNAGHQELIEIALEGSRQIEKISRQLLQYVRGEQPRIRVDLSQNVALALQLLGANAEQGARVQKFVAGPEPFVVLGEPGSLNQVWVNLIDNAIQAAGPKGNVMVNLGREGSRVTVEVRDDGEGIAPENLERIFDPFFTTRPEGGGTGLGLSVVREIVHKHQGTLTVESRPGAGARFKISLPALDPAPEQEQPDGA